MSIAPSGPAVSAPFTVPPKGETVSYTDNLRLEPAVEELQKKAKGPKEEARVLNRGLKELEELVKELRGIERMMLAMMREKEGEKEGGEDMVAGGEEGQKE